MSHYDWTKFTLRIDIKSSPIAVYNAWATRSNLESWFLRRAEFSTPDEKLRNESSYIRAGDNYLWMWHGYEDKNAETGKILDTNGRDFIKFTFAGSCVVTVTTKLMEGRTVMELIQDHIPTDENSKVNIHIGCMKGWTFYMANLKSVIEGGVDLRNKNINIKNVINS